MDKLTFSEIEINSERIFYTPLLTEIEEKTFIGLYKLGDNTLKKGRQYFFLNRKTGALARWRTNQIA